MKSQGLSIAQELGGGRFGVKGSKKSRFLRSFTPASKLAGDPGFATE